MQSAERKIGLIPRVIVQGKWGLSEYALLVTDRRSILILEKGSKSNLGGALGGAIGAAIAQAVATKQSFDYTTETPDSFAMNPKNITIPHESLRRIEVKKGMLGPVYKMRVEYQSVDKGKGQKIKGFLRPPGEHEKQKKQEGLGKKRIFEDYARKANEVYRQALTPPQYQSLVTGPG